MPATQGVCSSASVGTSITGDDESAADVDEPPDNPIKFAKLKTPSLGSFTSVIEHDYAASPHSPRDRKESLLTQALLSSPELYPVSETELPVLTSDGGLTSPARTTTPSPPLPYAHTGMAIAASEKDYGFSPDHKSDAMQVAPATVNARSHETSVEAGLGRKRCISFACGRQSTPQRSNQPPVPSQMSAGTSAKGNNTPKRPCMLKFVCPMKPSRTESPKVDKREKSPSPTEQIPPPKETIIASGPLETSAREHRGSDSTIKGCLPKIEPHNPVASQTRKGRTFNRVDFQQSETTRFHEFACHFSTDDEWTNEQTAYRKKITVNDTLRKENAIRKLAEEAEEEAMDEEAEALPDDDNNDDLSDNDEDVVSDDGNETDDEEGFGSSDEESDGNSDYQFWTPGLTTAATSTDHLEHIRPIAHRVASDSSIESTINTHKDSARKIEGSRPKSPGMHHRAPELPDSSDFVVGTVDEDRPLEEAYMSCLEERRRSRHKLIPQDIDPSFPTSDPEANNENEEDDGSEESDATNGDPEASEEHESLPQSKISAQVNARKPPISSPRRAHSPSPLKLTSTHRSPPPRRLFGQSTHRLRSPPPTHRKLTSPPSSRRPSTTASPIKAGLGVNVPHLAQRPNLTHTTSLPRTPNPFWSQHRKARFQGADSPLSGTSPKVMSQKRTDSHSRGPIDIVQGLETKRQRRKDKFWRQHCRMAGKEKHRRCQPGKGAERMKELGLEMADRFRGYGQRAPLVLSV